MDKLRFFDDDCPSDDPIDGLLNRLGERDIKTKTGCRVLRDPETGKMLAVFPSVPFYPRGSHEQRKLENAWESRALAMTEAQVPIKIAPKPVENRLAEIALAKIKLERSD